MKTLRYLLIVAAMVSFLSVSAQEPYQKAKLPEAEMKSTSTMVGSGSTLPQAAVTGVITSDENTQYSSRQNVGPRRGRPGDWTDPYKDPIGDAMWPMMVLALVYGVWCRVYRRKRV